MNMRDYAERVFLIVAHSGSVEQQKYSAGRYDIDPRLRDGFAKDGALDVEVVYEALGVEDQLLSLIKMIMVLDMTEGEVHGVIKHRFTKLYTHRNTFVETCYPSWCRDFGFEPDDDFLNDFGK